MSYDRRKVAQHEAGHCAALLMLGHVPARVTADRPSTQLFGLMEHPWQNADELKPEWVRDLGIAILAGPLAEGKRDWPPRWPLEIGSPGDAGQLAACAKYLRWGRAEYDAACVKAEHLVNTRDFGRLVDVITAALVAMDELTADDLRRIVGPERLRRFGIPTPTPTPT